MPNTEPTIDIEIGPKEEAVIEQVRQQNGLATHEEAVQWLVHEGIQRRLNAMLPSRSIGAGPHRMYLVIGGRS